MDTNIDSLKIKIDKARTELSKESRNAIDAVDWKAIILEMRTEKGYSFTQIGDLETETELLLSGLLSPEDYPKELEKRLGIPKAKVSELVNEMNEKVFKKIRAELIKNIEREKISNSKEQSTESINKPETNSDIEDREELLKKIENPEKTPSILSQKLSKSFQIPKTETDHSLTNMTKGSEREKTKLPKVDPYREPTE